MDKVVDKVAAFVVRCGRSGLDLLVFDHAAVAGGGPASVQVPAGTVERGEDPVAAAVRELREETGVRCRRPPEPLAVFPEVLADDEAMVTAPPRNGAEFGRGLVVRVSERSGGRLRVSQGATEAWVPVDSVTREVRRHLSRIEPSTPTEERWRRPCDRGVPIVCYWTALGAAMLHPTQQAWLDRVRGDLAQGRRKSV